MNWIIGALMYTAVGATLSSIYYKLEPTPKWREAGLLTVGWLPLTLIFLFLVTCAAFDGED